MIAKKRIYSTTELRKVQKDLQSTVSKLRSGIKKRLGPKKYKALRNTRSKPIKLSPKLKNWIAKKK